MKILIFSDLHYAPRIPNPSNPFHNRKLTHLALPLLDKLIAKSNNTIKPDLALHLGDMIEDSGNKANDLNSMQIVCEKFKEFNCPFFTLVGNHEMRSVDTKEEITTVLGYKSLSYSFNQNGYHFVMLGLDVKNKEESSQNNRTQCVPEKDLEWLKEDLTQNKLPALIFVHCGVAEDNMENNWWFAKLPERAMLGNRKELKQIISQHNNILAVFSGHQHWTKTTIENLIPYFVVGSLTENINDDGVPDGVYFEVQLNGTSLSVKEEHIKL